jgi:YVTN family beta-propeller protein
MTQRPYTGIALPKLAAVGALAVSLVAVSACSPKTGAPAQPAHGYLVFATNEASGDLSVIDGETRAVIKTVPLGKRPRGLHLSPDGKVLYVAMSGSPVGGPGVDESKLPPPDKAADGIGVFDVASLTLQRVLRGISDPEQVAPTRDGKLVVASEDTGRAEILDAASGNAVAKVDVGGEPEGVAVSPDGRFAYMTSESDSLVTVLDLARNAKLKQMKVGERPRGVLFSPDGARAFVTGEGDRSVTMIDGRNHSILARLVLPDPDAKPMGLALSPDGAHLYVTTGRGRQLVSVKVPELTMEKSVEVGPRPWGVTVSPDGRSIFTANGSSNDVTVVDAASFQVVQKIPTGERPWGVAATAR